MLELRIAEKCYGAGAGRRVVLRDISFAARAGEVIAVLGASGIGKTTLLRILLGLDRDFDGMLRGPAGPVGAIFQEPRLLPWQNIAENIRLVRSREVPAPDVPALLAEAEVPGVGALMPGELSLGMAQRVAFARALAVKPRTIIADEPFASLDPGVAAALARRLGERARRVRTLVLFSTHNLHLAVSAASRVLVLSGAPATLVADVPLPDDAPDLVREQLEAEFGFLNGQVNGFRTDPASGSGAGTEGRRVETEGHREI
jgi:sulfonate transport system ATP-binding protein